MTRGTGKREGRDSDWTSGDRQIRRETILGQGRIELNDETNFENNLASDLFGKFSGCYKPTPLKMNLILEIRLASKQMGKFLL